MTSITLITGYASIFGTKDEVNDIMIHGAFDKCIKNLESSKSRLPLLNSHSTDEPIGVITSLTEDDIGLLITAELFTKDIPAAAQAYKLMQEKVLTGLSIGHKVTRCEFSPEAGKLCNARKIFETELVEISTVIFPAHRDARIINFVDWEATP